MSDKRPDESHQLKKEQQKAETELHRVEGQSGMPGKGKPDKQEGVGTTQRRMG